jgi:dienelactone hydrolase
MMARRAVRIAGIGAAVVLLLALVSLMLQLDFVQPTGPHPVGRTVIGWRDESRAEAATTDPADKREVIAQVWYPAQAGTGQPSEYFPDLARIAAGLRASGEIHPVQVAGLRFIRYHGMRGAALSDTQAAYPVILISPGNGTNVELYASLADDLASHGYVVVGLNHPYDVAAVALGGGQTAVFAPGPFEMQAHQAYIAERMTVRVGDVIFALDQLEALNAGEGLFGGRLDLSHVAVMGHSLGGTTAAQACARDVRFAACANLDGIQRGGPFGTEQEPALPTQTFMFITKEEQLHPVHIARLEALPGGAYQVIVHGAAHDSFTDGPLLMPAPLPGPNRADRFTGHVRVYLRAFFDQTLRDQPSTLLADTVQTPGVSVEVY